MRWETYAAIAAGVLVGTFASGAVKTASWPAPLFWSTWGGLVALSIFALEATRVLAPGLDPSLNTPANRSLSGVMTGLLSSRIEYWLQRRKK